MFRFLFQALLALFALRVLIGLGRHLSRSAGRGRPRGVGGEGGRSSGGSRPSRPGEPLIDRSSVIDVPFTEENPE